MKYPNLKEQKLVEKPTRKKKVGHGQVCQDVAEVGPELLELDESKMDPEILWNLPVTIMLHFFLECK